MPIRYVIREVNPGEFLVEPEGNLPTWKFRLGSWQAVDPVAVRAEAELTLPPVFESGVDLTDVQIIYIIRRPSGTDGTGSARGG